MRCQHARHCPEEVRQETHDTPRPVNTILLEVEQAEVY